MLLSLLAASATQADASTITALFSSASPSGTVQRSLDSGATWTTLTVGLFNLVRTGGDWGGNDFLPAGASFVAFCIEPQEGVTPGRTYTWTVSPLEAAGTNIGGIGAARASQVRELLGVAYPVFGTPLTALQAAAIQIALWEIVREQSGSLNITGGTSRYRNPSISGMLTVAQSYLDQMDGNGPFAPGLLALIQTNQQDIVVQTETPEPTSLSLAALPVFVLVLAAHRRRRRGHR